MAQSKNKVDNSGGVLLMFKINGAAKKGLSFQHDVCEEVAGNKSSLEIPVKPEQKEKKRSVSEFFKCEICGKVAKTRQALTRHAAYHTSDRPYSCEVCLQKFKNTDDRGKHYRRLKRDGKFENACQVCHKHFKSDALLQKHLVMLGCEKNVVDRVEEIENNDENVTCENDEKVSEGEKKNSSKTVVSCVCKICNVEFSYTYLLKNHYKEVHKDTKRQVCIQCGHTLSSKDSLTRHYSIFHQEDYPFLCDYCDQKFKIKEGLCRHIKFVHKDGGYPCSVCKRIFSQPVNLKKHMAIHCAQKEYLCLVCGREFRWKQALQKHVLLHNSIEEGDDEQCDDLHLNNSRKTKIVKNAVKKTEGLDEENFAHDVKLLKPPVCDTDILNHPNDKDEKDNAMDCIVKPRFKINKGCNNRRNKRKKKLHADFNIREENCSEIDSERNEQYQELKTSNENDIEMETDEENSNADMLLEKENVGTIKEVVHNKIVEVCDKVDKEVISVDEGESERVNVDKENIEIDECLTDNDKKYEQIVFKSKVNKKRQSPETKLPAVIEELKRRKIEIINRKESEKSDLNVRFLDRIKNEKKLIAAPSGATTPCGTDTTAPSGTDAATPCGSTTPAPSGTGTTDPSDTGTTAPSGTGATALSGTGATALSGTGTTAPSGTGVTAPSATATTPSVTDTTAQCGTVTTTPSDTFAKTGTSGSELFESANENNKCGKHKKICSEIEVLTSSEGGCNKQTKQRNNLQPVSSPSHRMLSSASSLSPKMIFTSDIDLNIITGDKSCLSPVKTSNCASKQCLQNWKHSAADVASPLDKTSVIDSVSVLNYAKESRERNITFKPSSIREMMGPFSTKEQSDSAGQEFMKVRSNIKEIKRLESHISTQSIHSPKHNPFIIQNNCKTVKHNSYISVDSSVASSIKTVAKKPSSSVHVSNSIPPSICNGKFSLVKHMLSLKNEDNFNKALFDNPLYNHPSHIKDFKKMAEMHKIVDNTGNSTVEKYDLSGKQNIPFQWLGLGIGKNTLVVEKNQKKTVEKITDPKNKSGSKFQLDALPETKTENVGNDKSDSNRFGHSGQDPFKGYQHKKHSSYKRADTHNANFIHDGQMVTPNTTKFADNQRNSTKVQSDIIRNLSADKTDVDTKMSNVAPSEISSHAQMSDFDLLRRNAKMQYMRSLSVNHESFVPFKKVAESTSQRRRYSEGIDENFRINPVVCETVDNVNNMSDCAKSLRKGEHNIVDTAKYSNSRVHNDPCDISRCHDKTNINTSHNKPLDLIYYHSNTGNIRGQSGLPLQDNISHSHSSLLEHRKLPGTQAQKGGDQQTKDPDNNASELIIGSKYLVSPVHQPNVRGFQAIRHLVKHSHLNQHRVSDSPFQPNHPSVFRNPFETDISYIKSLSRSKEQKAVSNGQTKANNKSISSLHGHSVGYKDRNTMLKMHSSTMTSPSSTSLMASSMTSSVHAVSSESLLPMPTRSSSVTPTQVSSLSSSSIASSSSSSSMCSEMLSISPWSRKLTSTFDTVSINRQVSDTLNRQHVGVTDACTSGRSQVINQSQFEDSHQTPLQILDSPLRHDISRKADQFWIGNSEQQQQQQQQQQKTYFVPQARNVMRRVNDSLPVREVSIIDLLDQDREYLNVGNGLNFFHSAV